MKTIPALIALVLSAGPAIASPLPGPSLSDVCRAHAGLCAQPGQLPALHPTYQYQQPVALPPLPQPSAASRLELIDRMLTASRFSRGSVYVRAHTRCNSSKCWPVRSYTRSR